MLCNHIPRTFPARGIASMPCPWPSQGPRASYVTAIVWLRACSKHSDILDLPPQAQPLGRHSTHCICLAPVCVLTGAPAVPNLWNPRFHPGRVFTIWVARLGGALHSLHFFCNLPSHAIWNILTFFLYQRVSSKNRLLRTPPVHGDREEFRRQVSATRRTNTVNT